MALFTIKHTKPAKEKTDLAYAVPKEEKQEDIFAVPKEESIYETSKEDDLFKVDEKEAIDEINMDLYSEERPIEIKDKYTLLVKASGKTHEITRKDFAEYQKRYGFEGQDGRDISGFRNLGTIEGDWRPIDDIAQDVASTFGRIDERLGAYGTSYKED